MHPLSEQMHANHEPILLLSSPVLMVGGESVSQRKLNSLLPGILFWYAVK